MTLEDDLTIELVHEEIGKLLFFVERHHRWSKVTDDRDVARQQRAVADTLKDAVDSAQVLIERLRR